jgi:hypothetical protein
MIKHDIETEQLNDTLFRIFRFILMGLSFILICIEIIR